MWAMMQKFLMIAGSVEPGFGAAVLNELISCSIGTRHCSMRKSWNRDRERHPLRAHRPTAGVGPPAPGGTQRGREPSRLEGRDEPIADRRLHPGLRLAG